MKCTVIPGLNFAAAAYHAAYGFDQFGRIVTETVFDHRVDILEAVDLATKRLLVDSPVH